MPPMKQLIQIPTATARWAGIRNMLLIRASVDGISVAPATPSSSSRRRPTRSPRVPMVTSRPAIRNP
jgi:hypothetical protein